MSDTDSIFDPPQPALSSQEPEDGLAPEVVDRAPWKFSAPVKRWPRQGQAGRRRLVPGVAPTSARHRLRTGTGIGTDLPRRVFWPELLLLVLLRGSFLPELPAPNQPAFAASFQALLSVEVQDFLLQFSWPCIKELTAHIYGRFIVIGLSVISVDCTQILAI